MLKEELSDCINDAYEKAKKLIIMCNDYKMQQIRLETANLRRIEEYRQGGQSGN